MNCSGRGLSLINLPGGKGSEGGFPRMRVRMGLEDDIIGEKNYFTNYWGEKKKKGFITSPSGNRTPVSRVTGGDTHHYTNEEGVIKTPFGPPPIKLLLPARDVFGAPCVVALPVATPPCRAGEPGGRAWGAGDTRGAAGDGGRARALSAPGAVA